MRRMASQFAVRALRDRRIACASSCNTHIVCIRDVFSIDPGNMSSGRSAVCVNSTAAFAAVPPGRSSRSGNSELLSDVGNGSVMVGPSAARSCSLLPQSFSCTKACPTMGGLRRTIMVRFRAQSYAQAHLSVAQIISSQAANSRCCQPCSRNLFCILTTSAPAPAPALRWARPTPPLCLENPMDWVVHGNTASFGGDRVYAGSPFSPFVVRGHDGAHVDASPGRRGPHPDSRHTHPSGPFVRTGQRDRRLRRHETAKSADRKLPSRPTRN